MASTTIYLFSSKFPEGTENWIYLKANIFVDKKESFLLRSKSKIFLVEPDTEDEAESFSEYQNTRQTI